MAVLQVFYHLGELDQALTYALGAGSLFDITEQTEYVQTILCKPTCCSLCRSALSVGINVMHILAARCVDLYLEQRNQEAASSDKVNIDGRLVAIVERMFERFVVAVHSELQIHVILHGDCYDGRIRHLSLGLPSQDLNYVPRCCRCFADGQFEQAVGIALEARRLDKLEQTIKSSPDMVKILTYSLQVCQTLVVSREFRQQVICCRQTAALLLHNTEA